MDTYLDKDLSSLSTKQLYSMLQTFINLKSACVYDIKQYNKYQDIIQTLVTELNNRKDC